MNKLKTNINGKFPFVLDDIRFLDDVYRSAINSIIAGLMRYDGIIYGCKLTINGKTATVSEGAIWLNNEPLQVPEQTFNYNTSHNYFFKLSIYNIPEGNKIFGDGTNHDTYEARVGKVHDGGSSTSLPNMIKITASKLVDNAPGRLARLSTHQDNQNGLKPNAVVGTSSSGTLVSCFVKSAFNKDFANKTEILEGVVSTKPINPSGLQNHGDWISVLAGPFTGVMKVRKLTDGRIEMKGNSIAVHVVTSLFAILPEGYRPDIELKFPIYCEGLIKVCTIGTNGECRNDSAYSPVYINITFSTS